jgi:hypothetical protein
MEQNEKDPILWEIAQKRAAFKKSLLSYVIVNIFLWALWYFGAQNQVQTGRLSSVPWPTWVTLGWGIGLAFQYFGAYIAPKSISVEQEYNKLKNKN